MRNKRLAELADLIRKPQLSWGLRVIFCLILLISPASAFADLFVNVNTSPISGTSAQLAFDFIYGGGPSSNTATILDFSTTGTLGTNGPNSGDVTGTLPGGVSLSTAGGSFFNEYLTDITLGTTFSFQLDATTNAPGVGSLPDAFSFFLLDPNTGLPLFTTTDPSGADSLLTFNIDGSSQGALSVFSAPGGESVVSVTSVPEPCALLLIGTVLALLLLRTWQGRSWDRERPEFCLITQSSLKEMSYAKETLG
jgi:hypothetical protein